MKIIDKTNTSFNLPSCDGTGLDGLHSSNNWLNKGYKLFKEENLQVSFEEQNIFVSSDTLKKDYCLSYNVIPQLMLFEALQNSINLDEFLERAMSDKPTLSQFKYKQTDKQKTITDKKQLLSAKEYLKLNLIEIIKELEEDNGIFTTLDYLLPLDIKAVYDNKLLKEKELYAKYKELTDLNFFDIKLLEDTRLSCSIKFKDSDEALTGAIKKGYKVETTEFKPDMTLSIIMTDK